MKKTLAMMSVLLLAGTLLSGCGKKAVEETTAVPADTQGTTQAETETVAAAADTGGEKVKIEFWYAWGDKIGETNEELARRFNESQDKIEVVASYQGSYDDVQSKTQAAFAAGEAPAITMNETASVGTFARSGISRDLTDLVARDGYDLNNFNTGLMTNSYVDGKLYALPYMRSTPLMFVNTDMLEAAGLDPKGPENWDELTHYAEVMAAQGKDALCFPIVNEWYFEAFLGQAGGTIFNKEENGFNFNNEAGESVLNYWRDLQKTGGVNILFGSDSSNMSKAEFASQNCAMLFASVADINYFLDVAKDNGFNCATAFLPGNKTFAIPTGGANLIITSNKSEEETNAAWEFMKWVLEDEQTIYASQNTGYVPVTNSAVESDAMKAFYAEKPQFKVAVDQLQYILARPISKQGPEVHKAIKDMVTEFLMDENVSAKEVLDKTEKQCLEILNE